MRFGRVRAMAKRWLPLQARRWIRAPLRYVQRVGRWTLVLWQVRGVTPGDQLKLLASALTSPALSLRHLGQWQDPQLLFDARVQVSGVGEFELRKHTDDLWHVLPFRERRVADAILGALEPGDTFVDAGANVGFFSVLASRVVGERGRVVAIEMMPDTAAMLRGNIALNGLSNVTVEQYALSSHAGETITARVSVGKHGQATIGRRDVPDHLEEVSVVSATLDQLLRGVEPKMVKMDLEGAEKDAADGAVRTFAKVRAIVFEDWGEREDHDTLATRLVTTGFRVRKLDGRNWLAYR